LFSGVHFVLLGEIFLVCLVCGCGAISTDSGLPPGFAPILSTNFGKTLKLLPPRNLLLAFFLDHLVSGMKLISYVAVNQYFRRATATKAPSGNRNGSSAAGTVVGSVQYPHNLTVWDLVYFMMAPTLCYELNFPRTPTIRFDFVARRATEVVLLCAVMISISQQVRRVTTLSPACCFFSRISEPLFAAVFCIFVF
jgi:hypothetical protein